MIFIRFLIALLIPVSTFNAFGNESFFTLDQLEGGWWESCDDPIAVFFLEKDSNGQVLYSGDFLGSYPAELKNNVLTLTKGLPEGHSINVSGVPASYKVLHLSEISITLEQRPKDEWSQEITLLKCDLSNN